MIAPPTLPIRPLPKEGETFGSYAERIAADRDAPIHAVLAAVGLAPGPSPRDLPSSYGVLLPPAAVARAAHSLRLPEERVREMLLDRYEGTAFTLPDLVSGGERALAVFAGREWVHLRRSCLCPRCLYEDDGAWQLSWRLPLVFACTKHRLLLADSCPSCALALGATRSGRAIPFFVRSVPTLGHCGNAVARHDGGYGTTPCGYDLTTIKTVALGRSPRLLAAQESVLAALAGESQLVGGSPLNALQYLHDLRVLCGLMLHVARVDDLGRLPRAAAEAFAEHEEERQRDLDSGEGNRRRRFVRATPDSPALIAAVLPQAVEMLGQPTRADVAESVIWVITRSRRAKRRWLARIPPPVRNSPTLLPIWQEALQSLDFSKRVRSRQSGRGRVEVEAADLACRIPQLLWPGIFQRDFALLAPPGMGEMVLRRFCSIELVRLLAAVTRREAAAALELSRSAAATASSVAADLRIQGTDAAFMMRLEHLAERVSEGDEAIESADYAERRRLLRDLEVVPWDDWCSICAEADAQVGELNGRHRYAAVWLWEELTLSDYREAAGLRGRPHHHRYHYTKRFVRHQLASIEAPLRRYGDQLLAVA